MRRIIALFLFILSVCAAACTPVRSPEDRSVETMTSASPAVASHEPSEDVIEIPTSAPSRLPTAAPTAAPTEAPTAAPTNAPTATPTAKPTAAPTAKPTAAPTAKPTAAPTAKPTTAPTAKPTTAPTAKPTTAPTAKPTAKPTDPPSGGNQSVFDNAVFIGSSVLHGIHTYGIITHGTFLTKIGVNVSTVYTAHLDGSSKPIIDELNGKSYSKIILNFGTNESGWPSKSTFINKYGKLIDDVRSRVPGSKVYVLAITPVTKARSNGQGQSDGINMKNINALNGMIADMCSGKGVRFIGNPSAFLNSEGYLPSEASSDGIHLNPSYYRIWANHIIGKVS